MLRKLLPQTSATATVLARVKLNIPPQNLVCVTELVVRAHWARAPVKTNIVRFEID